MLKLLETDAAVESAYYAAVTEADIAADAEMEAYLEDMQAGYLAGSWPDEDEIDAIAESFGQ